jgi:copper(I)-binding protein
MIAVAVAATTVTVTGLLSACGTGQIAATANIVPSVPGANADVWIDGTVKGGVISVRDLTVEYPGDGGGYAAGQSAPLSVRIFNTSPNPVTLVGVQATILSAVPGPQATSAPQPVALVRAGGSAQPTASTSVSAPAGTGTSPSGGTSLAPAPNASTTATPKAPATAPGVAASANGPTPTGSARPQPTVVETPSPVTTPTPSTAGAALAVVVPPAPALPIVLDKTSGTDHLQLTNLTQALSAGDRVNLIFTFKLIDGSIRQIGTAQPAGGVSQSPQPVVAPIAPPPSPVRRATPDIGSSKDLAGRPGSQPS